MNVKLTATVFLEADKTKRQTLLKQIKTRSGVESLLLSVSTVRCEVTHHPYLVQAHMQIKKLKEKLKDKPDLLRDMSEKVRWLKVELDHLQRAKSTTEKESVRLAAELKERKDVNIACRQEHEVELQRLMESADKMADEMNHLRSENERLYAHLDAALEARSAQTRLLKSVNHAAICDVRLAEFGTKFVTESE